MKEILVLTGYSKINKDILTNYFYNDYELKYAASIPELINILDASNGKVAIAIIDYYMMKTYDVTISKTLSKIKHDYNVSLVASLSTLNPKLRQEAINKGFDSLLLKPFDPYITKKTIEYAQKHRVVNLLKAKNISIDSILSKELTLNTILDKINIGILLIQVNSNGTFKVVFCNNKKIADSSNNNENDIEKIINKYVVKEDIPPMKEKINELVTKKITRSCGDYRVNIVGKIIYIYGESELIHVDKLNSDFILTSLSNITDLKNVERKLLDSNTSLYLTLNNLKSGIIVYESNCKTCDLVFANKSFYNLIHTTPDEFKTKANNMVTYNIHPDDISKFHNISSTAINKNKSCEQNIRIITFTQDTLYCLVRCFVINKETNKLGYIILDMTERIKTYEKIESMNSEITSLSDYDQLTNLINRRVFHNKVRELLAKKKPDEEYVMIKSNIQRFRLINESFGYKIGDFVIISASKMISKFCEEYGFICTRSDSDHFLIFAERSTLKKCPVKKIDYVSISENVNISVTFNFGCYIIKDVSIPVELMVDYADFALKSIKNSKEIYTIFDSKLNEVMNKTDLFEEKAPNAFKNHEFVFYLQPIYDSESNKLICSEALVRWKTSSGELLSPGEFIPIFEKDGLIIDLDIYMLNAVCTYIKDRKDRGLFQIPISFNLSRVSFFDDDIVTTIIDTVKKYDIDHSLLHIEITESTCVNELNEINESIIKLKEAGFVILMDDFGSGFSSLNVLNVIPVDVLKLDRVFINNISSSLRARSIVSSVIALAKELKIHAIAEGVETKDQLDLLSSSGCHNIQGYYYSRPLPVDDFELLKEYLER